MSEKDCSTCGTPYHSDYVYQTPWSDEMKRTKGQFRLPKILPKGRVSQGNHQRFSHSDSIAHAFDLAVPIGTPVVAAREGVVVDTCRRFKKGGLKASLKLKANYVVIRHPDGTYGRYYHLRHKGVVVKKGDKVVAGDHIGYSGSTGYSGAPHLHIDVQDRYHKEIAEVKLMTSGGSYKEIEVSVSNVSARLPPQTESLELTLQKADPFLCTEELQHGMLPTDTALFCLRGKTSFAEKAQVAIAAGARALIVVNNDSSVGEVLPNIGLELELFTGKALKKGKTFPQQLREHEESLEKQQLNLIMLFVSSSTGSALKTGAKIRVTTHRHCPDGAFPYRKPISLPFYLRGVNDV